MKCSVCNHDLIDNVNYCPNCGAKINKEEVVNPNIETVEVEAEVVETTPNDNFANKYRNIYGHNYNKKSLSTSAITLSIICAAIAFFIGSFYVIAIVIGLLSIYALYYAIKTYKSEKNRKAGWAIAIAGLAIVISIYNFTFHQVQKKYAYESLDRIKNEVIIKLPDKKPEFYFVTMMDDINLSTLNYSYNEFVYKLTDEEEVEFLQYIESYGYFQTLPISPGLSDKFPILNFTDSGYYLVFNRKTKMYKLPEDLSEAELVIIIYEEADNHLSIIELRN